MSLSDSEHYLLHIELKRAEVPSFKDYPFALPAVRNLERLTFAPKVTFFVGENGSGKSTLLEAIARGYGLNPEGGSKNLRFSTRASHSELFRYLTLARGFRKAKDSFFLRAESFYNMATQVEDLGVTGYGDVSLHEQSHGESFLSLLMNRFRGSGLYILDEPEAALSPSRQLAMLARMHDLICDRSQFIIATHSPIIMAYPGALIYHLSDKGPEIQTYRETEHFNLTKQFLDDPDRYFRQLLPP